MTKDGRDFEAMRKVIGSGGIIERLGNSMTAAKINRKLDGRINLCFVKPSPPIMRAPGTLNAGAGVFRVFIYTIEGIKFAIRSNEFQFIGKLDADASFVIPTLGIVESEVKDPFSVVLEGAIDRAVTIHEERGADVLFIGIPPIDGTGRFTGTAIGWRVGSPALGAVPDDVFLQLLLREPLPAA